MIRILQLPLVVLAYFIRLVSVNTVSFEEGLEKSLVRKRRNRLAWLLIFPGNVVFATRRPRLKVLYNGEWIQWEQIVNKVLRDQTIVIDTHLVYEKLPGRSMMELMNQTEDESSMRTMLVAATKSLSQLHNTSFSSAGSTADASATLSRINNASNLLSHGDASLHNVLFDDETGSAEWFDFDLRHDLGEPAKIRQADDLRAFLFSTAHFFQAESIESFVDLVRETYADPNVWSALQRQISSPWFPFDVFHLSQIRRSRTEQNVGRVRQLDAQLHAAISTQR